MRSPAKRSIVQAAVGKSFTGFIAGLWLGDRLIRFTTCNGTKLWKLRIDPGRVELGLASEDYLLGIEVARDSATAEGTRR